MGRFLKNASVALHAPTFSVSHEAHTHTHTHEMCLTVATLNSQCHCQSFPWHGVNTAVQNHQTLLTVSKKQRGLQELRNLIQYYVLVCANLRNIFSPSCSDQKTTCS